MKQQIRTYVHKTQYYETDQMGIIHHSNYIRWFEEARVDFLEQIGYSYQRLEQEGVYSPVLKISCEYKSMIRFGDRIEVQISLTSSTPYKFTIRYRLTDAGSGEDRAAGESSHCYMDGTGMPVSIKKENHEFYETLDRYKE